MNTNGIHGKAMLVTLNITQWSARKTDKKATADVKVSHQVQSDKGAYYKSLIEGGKLEEIRKVATEARTEHYRRTLPWYDNGPRILSALGYLNYMEAMRVHRARFDQLVNEFEQEYPLKRQEAKRLLGTLFDEAEYLPVPVVRAKFSFGINVTPLPMGDDFRCDLGTEEIGRIRQEIEANTQAAAKEAILDAFDQVAKVVEAFMDRLAKPDTKFRDSLVDNARQLADLLPSLNFIGDPQLTALTKQLQDKLCVHEPDTLRHDPLARRQAYDHAVAMHKDLINFFGGAQ